MIDWFFLFSNALWILGLAVALAVFSFGVWQKGEEKVPFSTFFGRAQPKLFLLGAGILFSIGLALNVDVPWQKAAWGVLVVADLVYFILSAVKLIKAR
ncbi:MAG TPA: hypothetical protein VMS73_09215 [Anaerolineaceae bacterium]|nr:hypothetical protein [Anaerolineaceae bacterium]